MKRRGFVLLTVLWVVAALSVMVAASLTLARTGSATSRNRIVLTRGGWAREACVEILLARYAQDPSVRSVDTTDLGRGAWCRAALTDASARLDLNLASPDAIRGVLANDTLADALLDWRDGDDLERPLGAESAWYHRQGRRSPRNGAFAAVEELILVRGFDSTRVALLTALLTVDGTGQLNLNGAEPEALATIPGMGPDAVAAVMSRRAMGEPISGSPELASLLSPASRDHLMQHYQEFSRQAAYGASRFIATIEGGVRDAHPVSRAALTLVPAAGRLAVLRRRTE